MKYDGFKFVLHEHIPVHGSLHLDLRFEDLYGNFLHSFAVPIEWKDEMGNKVCYKVDNHDKNWLYKKHSKLKILDSGLVDYKVYKPNKYIELDFHGKLLNGIIKLWKLNKTKRTDAWLLYK